MHSNTPVRFLQTVCRSDKRSNERATERSPTVMIGRITPPFLQGGVRSGVVSLSREIVEIAGIVGIDLGRMDTILYVREIMLDHPRPSSSSMYSESARKR